jgi:hypothetical protein
MDEAYNATINILSQYFKDIRTNLEEVEPKPNNSTDISPVENLDYYSAIEYRNRVCKIERNVQTLKHIVVSRFNQNIDSIINGARNSFGKISFYTLYPSEILLSYDTNRLNECSIYLLNTVPLYTPDKNILQLSYYADNEIKNIIKILDIEMIKVSQIQTLKIPAENNKDVVISELIGNLNYVKNVVNEISIGKWKIDEVIVQTKMLIEKHIESVETQESIGKGVAYGLLVSSGAVLLGTIILSIILLVVRDFMSALIDTATNTDGMLKKLSGMDIEQA